MENAYLLLGSNENNRLENLEKARGLIELRCGKISAQSALYETEAWGLKEQNPFINQAILITTFCTAEELLVLLKTIEKEVGRVETVKWGPRVIDIDILFYGNQIVQKENLVIPHRYLHQRRFTLMPLHQIAPCMVHPVLNKTVGELLEECEDGGEVRRVD
jgi:2-amino-4-hydroxy-6-hydroxymethyldihydropteridine diphosphokinase